MSDESKPKTVKIRIAVAVAPGGEWDCSGGAPYPRYKTPDDVHMGFATENLGDDYSRFWIEAELPVPEPRPEPTVVNALVKPEG